MGFWDSVGSVAKGAMNSIEKYNNDMQALKAKMSSKSSDELRRIAKNGSSENERRMALFVLKERGEI